jgi:hypothetical protein
MTPAEVLSAVLTHAGLSTDAGVTLLENVTEQASDLYQFAVSDRLVGLEVDRMTGDCAWTEQTISKAMLGDRTLTKEFRRRLREHLKRSGIEPAW